MALAGRWDTWKSPTSERSGRSPSSPASQTEMAAIHDRMPMILPQDSWPRWLGEEEAPLEAAAELLVPYSKHLVMWPVHRDVGSVKIFQSAPIGSGFSK